MPKSTIALCIISSEKDLTKASILAGNLREYVDEIVLTGPEEFKWVDDFAKARNFNFSQAKTDWILWLDADDTLEHPENLRTLVEHAEENKIQAYWFPYQYHFDENGNCDMEHWKCQLLKNDGHFEWRGAIHEDPIMLRSAKWKKTRNCIRVHHTTAERSLESEERNLRILLSEKEKNPKEPRTLFYLGRTYVTLGKYQEAVDELETYLELSGWDEERYEAQLLIGKCFVAGSQWDEALLTYNAAILEKEDKPDAYIEKGICYLNKKEFNNALYNFKIAVSYGIPDSDTYTNPLLYTRDVYSAIAICYMNLGQLKEALISIVTALKADPKNKDLLGTRAFIITEKQKYDTAVKYVDIAKFLEKPEKIQRLLSTIPPELSDNEMLLALRNTFDTPKIWAKKTIAIYCGSSAEPWTPLTANTVGIGGSETAVVELSKRLVKLGWDVTVFNYCETPPGGQEFDGVHYKNYWLFNVKDTFDVLWVWRVPELFDYQLKARVRLLDLHDTISPMDFPEYRLNQIDKIFVKTRYHRSLYPAIPDNKFVVINNGIDLKRFEDVVPREPHRFLYTSSPTRGLDVLLKMWPKIKEQMPDAELHVYYGWKTYYEVEKNNPERMAWMKKMQSLMDQPGVINHDRVPQNVLAQEMLKSSYWLYPTDFPEISCITAMEMQAAKVFPITTGYAALAETQITGFKLPGDIHDLKWQDEFVETVIEADQEGTVLRRVDLTQFSWDSIADSWNKELCE